MRMPWRPEQSRHGVVTRVLLAVGITLGTAGLAGALGAAGPAGASTHVKAHARGDKAVAPKAKAAKSPKVAHRAAHVSKHRGQVAPAVSATPRLPLITATHHTFTVNTTTDLKLTPPSTKSCHTATATKCSLRAAIDAANNDLGNVDTVTVPAGTYNLKNGAGFGTITVTNSMLIAGPTSGSAVVDAQHNFEILDIYSTTTGFEPAVEVSNLTLQNGLANNGGLIYEDGAALTLNADTLQGAKAQTRGGAIYDDGGALWTDPSTTIANNTSTTDGGGIYSTDGQISIDGSTLSDNTASTTGGAIYNDGALASNGAHYIGNTATDGGVFYNDWSMSDTGSTYRTNTLNTSPTTYGGVLYNTDQASVTGATISGTRSSATTSDDVYGGAFYNTKYEQLTLTNDTSVQHHQPVPGLRHLRRGGLQLRGEHGGFGPHGQEHHQRHSHNRPLHRGRGALQRGRRDRRAPASAWRARRTPPRQTTSTAASFPARHGPSSQGSTISRDHRPRRRQHNNLRRGDLLRRRSFVRLDRRTPPSRAPP